MAVAEGFISGGLMQTAVMNQMQADVYEIPLFRMDNCESTARGALISALTGQKVCKDAEEAVQTVNVNAIFEKIVPNMKKTEEFRRIRAKMKDIYQKESAIGN